MSEITHADLRAIAADIKTEVQAAEARTTNRVNEVVLRLDRLNSKTATHAEAIAEMRPRLRALEKETFDEGEKRSASSSRGLIVKVGLGGAGLGALGLELLKKVLGL